MRRALLFLFVFAGCQQPGFKGSDEQLAEAMAKELIESCPDADPASETARSDCAVKLTESTLLRDNMAEKFLWGQQQAYDHWAINDHMTRFHPLVWRRLYLSVYMFPGGYTVEKQGDYTLLKMEPKFRSELDMGSYPYPFWHRPGKWAAYFLQKHLIFFIKDGKIVASRRSFEGTEGLLAQPPFRPSVVHEWGGQWKWTLGGEEYPKAVLFSWLLSKDNPHREKLEESYRDLEFEMRKTSCFMCHQPDNPTVMGELEILSYPNQALSSRHRIVKTLEENTMPRADAIRGIGHGYTQEQEPLRQKLLELSKTFAKIGDDALRFEGEQVVQ